MPTTPLRVLVAGLATLSALGAAELADLQIHGFISQGFLDTSSGNYLADTQDGSFQYNEVALNVSAALTDDLRAGIQIFSGDLGEIGNNRVAIDWAYLDWRPRQEIGLRVGIVKAPFGFYNEYQDVDVARTTVLMPQAAYDARLRDFFLAFQGALLYGDLNFGKAGSLEWSVYGGTRNVADDSGVGRYFEDGTYFGIQSGLSQIPDLPFGALPGGNPGIGNYRLASDPDAQDISVTECGGASVIWNTPVSGLRVGASISYIDELSSTIGYDYAYDLQLINPVFGIPAQTVGVHQELLASVSHMVNYMGSIEYSIGDWRFTGEYFAMNGTVGFESDALGTTEFVFRPAGWYLQTGYTINEHWQAALTGSFAYDDRTDMDQEKALEFGDDAYNDSHQYDYSAALCYTVNSNWLVKAEVHYIDGYSSTFGIDNLDNSQTPQWWMFACKTTANF